MKFIRETPAEYHAQSKKYMSSHQLADFRKCPLLYKKKHDGLVETPDSPAFIAGRAIHCLALEGPAQFDREFAVGGPINPKTGKPFGSETKAFSEWAAQIGKTVLDEKTFKTVSSCVLSIGEHKAAQQLLAEGEAEGVVRTEYCGLRCQIRIDWYNPKMGIVDLKTCDDIGYFEADARRYGYGFQLAFYREVLRMYHSGIASPVYLVAVEKREPYRCGVWQVSESVLEYCTKENEAAMGRLIECVRNESWPTGYEETRVFDTI